MSNLMYLSAPGRGSGWSPICLICLCLAWGDLQLPSGPAGPEPACPAPNPGPGSAAALQLLQPLPVPLPRVPQHRHSRGAAPDGRGSCPAGTVAIWNLLTKSLLQCMRQPDGSLKLYPFRCFPAHDHAVRSIEWCKADRCGRCLGAEAPLLGWAPSTWCWWHRSLGGTEEVGLGWVLWGEEG